MAKENQDTRFKIVKDEISRSILKELLETRHDHDFINKDLEQGKKKDIPK
jgi:hypothetical protein